MSTTRLLILGAVRIFQPVHGYFIRRELVSWEVDCWAHMNPGSVYNALRKLSIDGYLVESAADLRSAGAARTTYSLTNEGEAEFFALVRRSLGDVDEHAADSLMAGVAFMSVLSRPEVLSTLADRLVQIEKKSGERAAILEHIRCDQEMPDHVQELRRLVFDRLDGEVRWTHDLISRIEGGAYAFAGEDQSDYFPGHSRTALH